MERSMAEELEELNVKSLKGTFTIENAKSVSDIPGSNSREHLFKVIKDYLLSLRKH